MICEHDAEIKAKLPAEQLSIVLLLYTNMIRKAKWANFGTTVEQSEGAGGWKQSGGTKPLFLVGSHSIFLLLRLLTSHPIARLSLPCFSRDERRCQVLPTSEYLIFGCVVNGTIHDRLFGCLMMTLILIVFVRPNSCCRAKTGRPAYSMT